MIFYVVPIERGEKIRPFMDAVECWMANDHPSLQKAVNRFAWMESNLFRMCNDPGISKKTNLEWTKMHVMLSDRATSDVTYKCDNTWLS